MAKKSIGFVSNPLIEAYTIEAIGDRNGLLVAFADSGIARQLKTMAAVEGITFRFTGKSGLRLQSVTVSEPHYAGLGAAGLSTATGSAASPSPSPSATESPR